MPLLLVRHAWAGERDEDDPNDNLRPLDERGREQAAALVDLLARFPLESILSSPYLRCIETVAPLAAARGLQPDLREELGEELQSTAGHELVRSLAGQDAAVCGHGGLEAVMPGRPAFKKGAVLVVSERLEVLESLRND
ncbi:MAG TPA: phosphoglycerate mutase family protein [Gaiellaceae bacterium]|nr:phosphoglycerate mutase family protein [Gaiellaceae bacterium]